jgi:hypothetical protein
MKIRPDLSRPRAFWILGDHETIDGYVDLDDPEHLDLEYTRVIANVLESLDFWNIVHVGGGGLMLPRYLHSKRPEVSQAVFEPDMDMIEFIGKTLKTLEVFNIVNATGEEGFEELPDNFTDLTIVDAFQGGVVPQTLLSNGFFDDLYRVSKTVLFNTIQSAPIEIPVPKYEYRLMLVPQEVLSNKERGNVMFLWSKDPLPAVDIRNNVPYPYRLIEIKIW